HLDRPLVNATELLHVSAFKPHELTQQFRTGDEDGQQFAHRAPWLDEGLVGAEVPLSHRLYRALEFLGTHSRTFGPAFAGTVSLAQVPPPPVGLPPYPNRVVVPAAMSGTTATGGTWRIAVGSSLVIDRGRPSEEVVRVKAVGPTPHVATWFVADFLRPHAAGFTITPATASERVPGRINLNTVWDEEVFLALCDPNPSNHFNAALARTVFGQLKASRTVEGEAPGPRDRPFRSLAAGMTPPDDTQRPGGGIQDTLLRFANPDDPNRLPMLAVPGRPHPYQTYDLLRKVFTNVTVRSNVFAVWVTVGFFEVTDDRARPVKLGGELGRSAGRHVRHRMFAIVDRSVLQANPGPQRDFDPRAAHSPGSAFGRVVPYLSIID
ncbi:MAG: hypothetical protein L0Y54_22690, partial [Sporichthyaceae bacterium]|nr:hypothetical protein [Sporichthyaceae bacterium]